MKYLLTLILALSFTAPFTALAGPPEKAKDKAKIEWLTIEEAQKRMKKQPRKIVVDVYTDWCGWCKRMDATTFSDPAVIEKINKSFYAVKFNAEDDISVIYKDAVLKKNPGKPNHDLVYRWIEGNIGFPTIVYLDEKLNVARAVPGYYNAGEFAKILDYIDLEKYKKMHVDEWLAGRKD